MATLPILRLLSASDTAFAATGGSAATFTIPSGTRWVRCVSTADARISFIGTVASTSSFLPAGSVEYFNVNGYSALSVVGNSTVTGVLNVTVAEL